MTVEKSSSYVLIQLDEQLLSLISNGQCQIKGNVEDDAIMVSSNESFSMRQVSSSNSLILLSPVASQSDPQQQVVSIDGKDEQNSLFLKEITDYYWDCLKIHGKIDKILPIFQRNFLYTGKESLTDSCVIPKITLERLEQTIQASKLEIAQTLDKLSILQMSDGFLYRLDDDFLYSSAKFIMSHLQLNETNNNCLNSLAIELDQPVEIWNYFTSGYFILPKSNNTNQSDECLTNNEPFEVNQNNFIKCICRKLFEEKPCWIREELITRIEQETCYNFPITNDSIELICYEKESKSSPYTNTLWFLDEKYLPFDLSNRIAKLFEYSSKWQHAKLLSFLL